MTQLSEKAKNEINAKIGWSYDSPSIHFLDDLPYFWKNFLRTSESYVQLFRLHECQRYPWGNQQMMKASNSVSDSGVCHYVWRHLNPCIYNENFIPCVKHTGGKMLWSWSRGALLHHVLGNLPSLKKEWVMLGIKEFCRRMLVCLSVVLENLTLLNWNRFPLL